MVKHLQYSKFQVVKSFESSNRGNNNTNVKMKFIFLASYIQKTCVFFLFLNLHKIVQNGKTKYFKISPTKQFHISFYFSKNCITNDIFPLFPKRRIFHDYMLRTTYPACWVRSTVSFEFHQNLYDMRFLLI